MMWNTGKKIRKRILSFKYAFSGLKELFRVEHNSWIHSFFAVAAIIAGFTLKISSMEWLAIIFAIGLVFVAEIINTAIERAVDLTTQEQHPLAKQAKDLAAGAVLLAAVLSVIVGLIIFGPKLIALL